MKKEAIFDMEQCYRNGDLAAALEEAAEVVKRVGETKVIHIVAHKDEEIDGWYVDVVYRV